MLVDLTKTDGTIISVNPRHVVSVERDGDDSTQVFRSRLAIIGSNFKLLVDGSRSEVTKKLNGRTA